MYKSLTLAGCALLLATSLSGCAGLQGLAGFNNALLPQLKPIDARIHTDITCGDLARNVLGFGGSISADQAVAIVQFCERRDSTQTLTLDPQGARKALDQAISHASSPVGVVAAVAKP